MDLMQLAPHLEVVGALFGVGGAWVIASGPRLAFYGFCCYLVSNLSWIGFAVHHGHWWQVAQQCCFFGATLLGLWRWRRDRFGVASGGSRTSGGDT
jgi:hypothetical protein